MRRPGTVFLCLVVLVGLNACGSSGGGGSGGAGGAGGTGGTAGSGGGAAGSGGAAGQGGAGGGAAGAGGTGGALAACGTSTAASTGTTCNAFDAIGPCVTATLGTGATPTPGGGPVQTGTYDLQSRTAYVGADAGIVAGAQMLRQTLVLSGGSGGVFTADTVNVNGSRVQRQHGTATVSGSQVDFAVSCPAPPDGGSSDTILGYTATTSALTTFNMAAGGIVVVDVYTMR